MKRVIFPRNYYDVPHRPVIFLAGPIHSAPMWQEEAARIILRADKSLVIASPRRILLNHHDLHREETQHQFFRQRPWEHHYMEKAGRHGCILFWLPEPEYVQAGVHYGATTRFELGEWMCRFRMDMSLGVEIGADGMFPTLHTIKYDMECNMPEKTLHQDLKKACLAAVDHAIRAFDRYQPEPDNPEQIRGLLV